MGEVEAPRCDHEPIQNDWNEHLGTNGEINGDKVRKILEWITTESLRVRLLATTQAGTASRFSEPQRSRVRLRTNTYW